MFESNYIMCDTTKTFKKLQRLQFNVSVSITVKYGINAQLYLEPNIKLSFNSHNYRRFVF